MLLILKSVLEGRGKGVAGGGGGAPNSGRHGEELTEQLRGRVHGLINDRKRAPVINTLPPEDS